MYSAPYGLGKYQHPSMFSFITKGRLYTIGAIACVCILFALGLRSGATNAYAKERATILEQIDATSLEYQNKATMLLQERSHCSLSKEIEAELTRLQEINAARRRQLQHIDAIAGTLPLE